MNPGEASDPDLQALVSAVPGNPFVAFILADYLAERDDPRRAQGELLRLVYTLTRAVEVKGRAGLEARMNALLRQGVRAVGPHHRVSLGDGVTMDFAWVPPGVFLMGSPEDEEGRENPRMDWRSGQAEGPRHEVALTHGFWMGTTPVTQIQFTQLMGENPSWMRVSESEVPETDRELPVQEVTWLDANRFLRKLSKQFGVHFRLPTEANWEYACRAGTTTRFWSGDADADLAWVGWYGDSWDRYTDNPMRPVGHGPNPLGLCDLHGNVWEWCADRYDENYYARSPRADPRCGRGEDRQRVIRGGGTWNDAADCRSAARSSNAEDCSHNDIGFRVVADRL